MRLSSWRPVCPDCEYPVRGLATSRCPECGIDFPTARRTFRRWATRRVPWDRCNRGSAATAYIKTLALILFLPWRAARGLALPDRWPSCVHWVVVHVVLAILACAMLANGQRFPRWIVAQVWPPAFDPPHIYGPEDAPAVWVFTCLGQSFVAWAITLLIPTALGSLLSVGIPGRHRAAKLGGVKWSLYLPSLYIAILIGWYGYYAVNPLEAEATFPVTFSYTLPSPNLPVLLLVGVYGVWWAIGMAANPYNRARGMSAFIVFGLLYATSWAIVVWVLFPVGALRSVL